MLGGSDIKVLLVAQTSKEFACNTGDQGSIPGSGRSPGEGNGYALQYSFLENSMDRGAWSAIVHGIIKSWTRLSNYHSTLLRYVHCFLDIMLLHTLQTTVQCKHKFYMY